jgi:2-methylcitrate dehydratase PrpD
MSITRHLADFVSKTEPLRDDHDAMQMMRLSLLDWMAVGLAGCQEPVARITRDMALAEGGTAQATILGTSTKVPARAAALANGAISHALDYDDTHFAHIGHPSVAVIPAALAVAQARGASGEAFRHAALLGIEASIRVGVWLGRPHYQAGFHQTATAGAFGAGLAAARLMDLGAAEMAMVMGFVATRASGLKSQFGTMGKPYNAGLAAANGVEAAQLVSKGFVANPEGLETQQGFGPTHAGAADDSATENLGEYWYFNTVSHKFHACCHGLHAALEAQASLLPLSAERVTSIAVHTHPRWLTVCNQPAPDTGLGAKFSYTTVLAMQMLGHDTAKLDSYDTAVCADPALVALRDRVRVSADDTLSETEARIHVETTHGVVTADHDLDSPMRMDVRAKKLHAKAASLLGEERAATIWREIENETRPVALADLMVTRS